MIAINTDLPLSSHLHQTQATWSNLCVEEECCTPIYMKCLRANIEKS